MYKLGTLSSFYWTTLFLSLHSVETKRNKKAVHRGEALKKAAEESGLAVEEIVERMHYASRTTFYNHTKTPDLSLAILKRYGKVLNYNFYVVIPEMIIYPANESAGVGFYVTPPKSIEEAVQQRDFYYQQYMLKLEELRRALEESNELKHKLSRYL